MVKKKKTNGKKKSPLKKIADKKIKLKKNVKKTAKADKIIKQKTGQKEPPYTKDYYMYGEPIRSVKKVRTKKREMKKPIEEKPKIEVKEKPLEKKSKGREGAISIETVNKVAKIARINLTKEEKAEFLKDLTEILAAFKVLAEAPDAQPSFQPYDIKDVFREDKEEEPLGQSALSNTEHKEKGFIKGPRVV